MTVTGVQRQVTNGLFNKVRTPRTCTVIRASAASQTAAAPVGHFPAVPTALALLRRRSSRQANALPSPAPGDPAAASSAADSGTSVDLCSTWPRPSPPRGHARPCASAREQGRPGAARGEDTATAARARRRRRPRLARSGRPGSQLRADSDPRRSRRARRAHRRRRPPRGAASSLGLARGRGQPASGPPAGGRPAGRAALPLVLHGHDEEEQQGGALHRRQQEEVVVQVAAVDVAWKREGVAAAHGHPPAGRGPCRPCHPADAACPVRRGGAAPTPAHAPGHAGSSGTS